MKVRKYLLYKLIFVFFIFSAEYTIGQVSGCKVLLPSISGAYSGDCKKGLANGNGVAQGIDHYEGHFVKGLPDGKGTYTWANGSYYQGQWQKGLKNGIGKMVYRTSAGDSLITGYWEKGLYKGLKIVSSYNIVRNSGVVRYTFRKVADIGDDMAIRIFLGGELNTTIEDFSMVYDSGDQFVRGSFYGIQNIRFPISVKITYRTWNQFHSSQSDVTFEFVLSQPGKWELTLVN